MSNKGILVGIDPGIKGAISFLDPEKGLFRVMDMPIFEFFTTKKRVRIDAYEIAREFSNYKVDHIYLEEVNSSPQMGVVSAFSFGEGKGVILGIAAALNIPLTQTKPTDWKKQMRVPADKKAAVQRASQLFPHVAASFKGPRGGVFDGRAEAALLALFGSMELGRSPTKPITLWEQ